MAEIRLGIMMHGVTGRMGLNQHLIRSIVAIRQQGGVALDNGDRVMPDPILLGRNAEALERLARDARHLPLEHGRGARARESRGYGVLRLRDDARTRQSARARHARRQTRVLREAGGAESERRARAGAARKEVRRQAWRRAGQTIPAGPAQARDAGEVRLLRPDPVGARRVRLLGIRRRSAADPAPLVELPRGRRRRHHPGHDVPLALRARQPVRGREERVLPGRHAYSAALGRARPAIRRHGGRCLLRDAAAGRRHRGPDQQLLVHARAARRSRHLSCRRHARFGGRGAHGLQEPGACEHAEAGLESRPAIDDEFFRSWQDVPDTRLAENGFKVQWEKFIRHVVADAPFQWDLLEGAKGVQLVECSMQSWRERRWVDVPALRVEIG